MVETDPHERDEDHVLHLTHSQFEYLWRLVQKDTVEHLVASAEGTKALGGAGWVAHIQELADVLEAFTGSPDK